MVEIQASLVFQGTRLTSTQCNTPSIPMDGLQRSPVIGLAHHDANELRVCPYLLQQLNGGRAGKATAQTEARSILRYKIAEAGAKADIVSTIWVNAAWMMHGVLT